MEAGEAKRYDPELQMFAVAPRDPDYKYLEFLRKLAERGRLEHRVFGPSFGTYAQALREQQPSQDPPPNSVFLNKLAAGS